MGGSTSASNENKTQRFEYINHNVGDVLNYYEFSNHIGIGRSATVYKAADIKTRLPRAIKELRKSKMSLESTDSFECEVKILKRLDHPNIMKIYEVIESSYSYYLACELLEGKNLMELVLENSKPFSDEMIARCMEDILYAISYCHEEKIAHNDIRPDNLVFEDNSCSAKLKLIDFGISSEVDESKGNYGQIHFRAPETFKESSEIQGKDDRLKSDIWSAGVVFFTLLTKKPLFRGKDKKVEEDIVNFEIISIEENVCDESALNLLKKMLDPDQSSRVSAKEALEDPYFNKAHDINESFKEEIQEAILKMASFISKSSFDTKMMSLIAIHILSTGEEKVKSQVFKAIDSKYDGYIDETELSEASKKFEFDQGLVKKIMNNCDLDKNGKISYTEFLTTSLNWKDLLADEEKIDKILSYFDVVRKEALTQEELQSIIKLDKKDDWTYFLGKFKDQNGLISKSSLQEYFLEIAENFL